MNGKPRTTRPYPPRRQAFTLVELLVVIAIISMLISILMPSLSRARQQAKATVCMATMSEIMKATVAYGNDFNFALPPMRYEVVDPQNPTSPPVFHGWAEALYVSLYQDDDFSYADPFPVMHNRQGRFSLWVDKSAAPLTDSSGHYRVYELTWSKGSLDAAHHRLPLVVDANPLVERPLNFDPLHDFYRADVPKLHIAGLEGEAYVDERHYGGANYSFRDGHVERSTSLKEKLALDWDLNPDTENR